MIMAPPLLKVFLIEQVGSTLIMTPQGDTSIFRYSEVHSETNSLLDYLSRGSCKNLLIDFSCVDLIGSLMFASVLKVARKMDEQKGKSCFCCASDTMREAMHTMNLTKQWPYFESKEAAVTFLLHGL